MHSTERSEPQRRLSQASVRRRSSPPAGQSPRSTDGEDAGAVERVNPFTLHSPDGEPPSIPPLRFTAQPPERAAYEAAFRAAWAFPHDLIHVMSGIRKGLERGQKAARRAGGDTQ